MRNGNTNIEVSIVTSDQKKVNLKSVPVGNLYNSRNMTLLGIMLVDVTGTPKTLQQYSNNRL